MSEPTSALEFYDLLLRVAEKSGMAYYGSAGQGKALVPIDAFNLDKCRRIVNDGFQLFKSSPPPRGWHWQERIASIALSAAESGTATGGGATTLVDTTSRDEADDYFNDWILTITSGTGVGETATITDFDQGTSTLTFSALSGGSTPDTTSVYRLEEVILLPEDFNGQADGPIEYAASSNHGTEIEWVDASTIRRSRADFTTTGYPLRAAILPYQPTAGVLGTARRWRLVVDPAPVAAETLEFPYTSHFNTMDCETGVATAGTAISLSDSERAEADSYFNSWIMTIIAGTGLGQTATITGYTGSTGKFDFSAGLSGSSTPDTTSVYYVEPAANLHPAGLKFDDAIRAACYAEAEKQIEEINEGAVELFYKVHLPFAHNMDSLSRPRKLQSKYAVPRERTWLNITTDHDV